MKNYRIVYSEQRQRFKIQGRVLWFFWMDLGNEEFRTQEEALDVLSQLKAYDWDVFK